VYRFLLSPRWIGAFLLCVLAALVCARLGLWQHHRLETKQTINASIDRARTADPVPAAQSLSTTRAPTRKIEYSTVEAVGQYIAADQVMVRNRSLNSDLGYLVLAPLRTTDGPTLWVVRGWVTASTDGATRVPRISEPPSGTVTVIGRVRLPESGKTDPVTVEGQHLVTNITRHEIGSTGPAYDAYVEAVSEKPSAADSSLTTLPGPDDLDEGIHIAYEVQWELFAIGFVVGFFWYARNYARQELESNGGAQPVRKQRPKRARPPLPIPVATRNGVPIAPRTSAPVAVLDQNADSEKA
jgi:cytochrome oxidase assembly protein ShyY1